MTKFAAVLCVCVVRVLPRGAVAVASHLAPPASVGRQPSAKLGEGPNTAIPEGLPWSLMGTPTNGEQQHTGP